MTAIIPGRMMALAPTSRALRMKEPFEESFLQAFEEYSDALFRHALFRISDREKAYDLTQDTYLKAWDYVQGGGEVQQYKGFLYRILHNLIIDEYRKTKPQSLDSLMEDAPGVIEKELSEGSVLEVEEELDETALILKVKSELPNLSPEYRAAVSMRFLEGLTPKEIAEVLGVTENVVSVRIHRGVAKLKTLLKQS